MKTKRVKTKPECPVIYMGVHPDSVEVVSKIILAIQDKNSGDAVKIAAIEAVSRSLQSNGHVIQNCNFVSKK